MLRSWQVAAGKRGAAGRAPPRGPDVADEVVISDDDADVRGRAQPPVVPAYNDMPSGATPGTSAGKRRMLPGSLSQGTSKTQPGGIGRAWGSKR
ncbi:hypothetical protein HaLaN_17584 [Haematococcus lacustris]|uniref:Uncharacterized protein n=1 Tax=Haematococcus lacustris TaxID=44745 RepID=A0A699ZH01_HAELA|nr:hypothetical protein HaLaN_17584 [Haematococcus lacustris]